MLEIDPKIFYPVKIYAPGFRHKSLAIKQRIQSQYLPKYRKKLQFDKKSIKQSQQDRLIQLTTKQIDRIIDMQKIKSALNHKKNGNRQTFLENYTPGINKHPNVYQANFLAKINKIAIQRNIFTQQSLGFQSIYGQQNPESTRRKQLQKQKQNIKYVKVFRSNPYQQKNKFSVQEMKKKNMFFIDDEKSISSINDDQNLQIFEDKLNNQYQSSSCSLSKLKRQNSFFDNSKILCSRKWFNGMSTVLLEKKNKITEEKFPLEYKIFDISSSISKEKICFFRSKKFGFQRLKSKTQPSVSHTTNESCKMKISIEY